jgi:hypothetical protein
MGPISFPSMDFSYFDNVSSSCFGFAGLLWFWMQYFTNAPASMECGLMVAITSNSLSGALSISNKNRHSDSVILLFAITSRIKPNAPSINS